MLLKKSYKRALTKIGNIVEIIMVMLNCSYLDAFIVVVRIVAGVERPLIDRKINHYFDGYGI